HQVTIPSVFGTSKQQKNIRLSKNTVVLFIQFNSHHSLVEDICVLDQLIIQFVYVMLRQRSHCMFSTYIWCVEFSPLHSNSRDTNKIGVIGGAGYTICSGSGDKTIRTVRSVKYSRNETSIVDGNVICSGSDDNTVRLWDIRAGKQINIFKGHTNTIYTVEYLPSENGSSDANIIYSGSSDNTIRFWDIRTNKQ
ncbi:WD-40 repeat protein, partial [Reticulomyxa filosa]